MAEAGCYGRGWMMFSGADRCEDAMSEGVKGQGLTVEAWAKKGIYPELGEIFGAIASAAVEIARKIRLAGLDDIYGAAGATNVQGEQQQKLDVFANEVLTEKLRGCSSVAGVVSEEDKKLVPFDTAKRDGKRFVLSFDPLDGSSNIDVNVNVGTIFGIRRLLPGGSNELEQTVLRAGMEQVAAGYVVYGPSVVFVATVGGNVSAFTLDDEGKFTQSTAVMQMPEQGIYYSANEANASSWPGGFKEFIHALLRGDLGHKPYSARYIGSLVADFHRTMLKGGIFLYPPTENAPKGKLRLQYEANPLAMIAEAAGGFATDGHVRILGLEANDIHQRTALVVGSRHEVELLQHLVKKAK